jgi:YHS domain-containing protein
MIAALLLMLAITPEECLKGGKVRVEHGGKTYRLATEECREQFLSDPERYAQLYDALAELEAQPASLVPS